MSQRLMIHVSKVSLLTVQAVENSEVNHHSSCRNPTYPECKLLDSFKQSDIILEVCDVIPVLSVAFQNSGICQPLRLVYLILSLSCELLCIL